MFLSVFALLLSLSIIMLIIGLAISEASFSIIGLVFLFVLSTGVLIPDNLEIKTGINTTNDLYYKYGNNFSGYHWDYTGTEPTFNPATLNDPSTVFLFHTYETVIEQNVYTNPETTFYGIWLSIIAGAGLFLIWSYMKPTEVER